MRRLALPLALACLCAAHAVSAGRSLSQQRPKAAINPATFQWVQMALTIRSKTCAELPGFDASFRTAFTADVTAFLRTLPNAAAVIPTIGDNGQTKPCEDITYRDVNYAGVRAAIRFRNINTTLPRDFLFDSAREGVCVGKYRTEVYTNVQKLAADTGNLKVSFNNASRVNPSIRQGAAWVWVVQPRRCDRSPLVASPSPAPAVQSPSPAPASPSPAPAVPSPSPAPSCASIPNSETAADGSCVCTKAGFTLRALDGDKLVSCLSSATALCPAPTSTAVKDNSSPVPKILSCITPATPCPAPYTFPLYAGASRAECRLPVVGCTYTPFTMVVEGASGLIGCVNPSFDLCPFVAYRSYSNNYRMDACRQVTDCPAYSTTSVPQVTAYTTAARAADRTLQACLTLNTDNVCPVNVPNADYPIEVVAGNPAGCGSSGSNTCVAGTRVAECLAVGAACDAAKFPLQLFAMVGSGSVRPTLVGCRQARPTGTCDLTGSGMGGVALDPNANNAPYNINVFQTQGNLVGCISSNVPNLANAQCPSDYPVAVRETNGNLKECRPATNSANPCGGNTAQPVPAMSADGTWLGICLPRKDTCLGDYATRYGTPVTIRNQLGEMIQCREQVTACPTAAVLNTDGTQIVSSFPLFRPSVADPRTTVIASCYPPAAIGSTCTITIDSNTQYNKPIRSNSTANAPLLGCMASTTTACPADYPFATMQNNVLQTCAPKGDLVTCPAGFTRATQGSGTLVGCLDLSSPKRCPPAYPTTVATVINGEAIECMAPESRCYKGDQPFSLFEEVLNAATNVKYLELTWCINPQQSITDCSLSNPAQTVGGGWIDAAEYYNNVGTSILGCIKRPVTGLTTCPVEAPFAFRDAAGSTFQCRESIAPADSCAAAVNSATAPPGIEKYVVNVLSGSTLVGCTRDNGNTCPPGGVLVSQTAFTPTELCLSETLNSCAGVKNLQGQDRSFPLYSGKNTDGTPKLVRCIAPITATDCSISAVDAATGESFNVPVYGNNGGSGNVIGCVRASGEAATPCPSTAPFYLVEAGASGELAACIQKPAGCNITSPNAWVSYTLPLYNADATVLLGCMKNNAPTNQCPSSSTTSPYIVPFAIRESSGAIRECRLEAANAVTNCAAYAPATAAIIASNLTGAVAPVIGCAIPGTGADAFPAGCKVPGFPVAFYNAAGQLVQCRSSSTPCDPANTGGFSVRYTSSGTLESCVDITLARRRQLLGAGNTNNTATNGCAGLDRLAFWSSSDILVECAKGYTLTSCDNLPSYLNTTYPTYTTELVFNRFNPSTVEGCLAASATSCPNNKFIAPLNANVSYPYSIVINSALQTCIEQSPCAANPCGTNASVSTCSASTGLPGFQCTQSAAAVLSVGQNYECVAPAAAGNNSNVTSTACTGEASQTWVSDDSRLRLLGTTYCITADVPAAGRLTTMTTCANTTSQQWDYSNSTQQFFARSNSSYCLDDISATLVTSICNNQTATQRFYINNPN